MNRLIIAVLLAVIVAVPAWAQMRSTDDEVLNDRLAQMVQAQVLTVNCPVPGIQPKVATLTRRYSPAKDKLIEQFLGSRESLIGGGEQIISPIHGKGTRYKSGTVIYALPMDNINPGQQNSWDLQSLDKLESVPAFLDLYSTAFLYSNNIPHKAVSMASVRVENPGPKTGKLKADYRTLYSMVDGRNSAEDLLSQVGSGLGVPDGFRRQYSEMVQDFGERLYSYRTWPEHLTSYTVYKTVNGKQQAAGEKQVAVPVLDVYAHVLLDGDKVLASMEYAWDSGLTISGTPKEALQAPMAVLKAREWLLKRFGNNPPLMNVDNIKLGYIANPGNRNQLVPAWIFDAWSLQAIKSNVPGVTATNPERVPDPFAVNALTGEVIDL